MSKPKTLSELLVQAVIDALLGLAGAFMLLYGLNSVFRLSIPYDSQAFLGAFLLVKTVAVAVTIGTDR